MATVVTNTAGLTSAGNTPANGPVQSAFGKVTLDATALTATQYLTVVVGFTPKYFCFENATDRIKVEWYEGMADDTCIKTAAAGTRTLETTNQGITVASPVSTTSATAGVAIADTTGRSVLISQNATLAVVAASKVCYWTART